MGGADWGVSMSQKTRWKFLASTLVVALSLVLFGRPQKAIGADASLVVAALRVLEQGYPEPVNSVDLLDAAVDALRVGTGLSAAALPDIPPGTSEPAAIAAFKKAFSRAARTGGMSATQLAYGATAIMLSSLHDSHTYFLDPATLRESRRELAGDPSFSGIGIRIVSRKDPTGVGGVYIDDVFPGSPAQKAGLRQFDKIVQIGGKSVSGATAEDISEMSRGPAGSMVTIAVRRGNQTVRASVVRSAIRVPPVEARFVQPGVAYVRVLQFSRGAGHYLRQALVDLASAGPIRGVILDLRDNPGGLIAEAVNIGGVFLPPGTPVARVIERGHPSSALRTPRATPLSRAPLAVLVNAGSASGAEIVAGALRDYQRTVIVGEKTAGALGGSVIVPLAEGGMSITVERILLPRSGRVEGIGISPDVHVQTTAASMERGEDVQLQAALRVVRTEQRARAIHAAWMKERLGRSP